MAAKVTNFHHLVLQLDFRTSQRNRQDGENTMIHQLHAALAPRKALATFTAAVMVLGSCGTPAFGASKPKHDLVTFPTATPIQHLVVIFDENISFDHYFGTYPVAANPPVEPSFKGAANTPSVNGLTHALLT